MFVLTNELVQVYNNNERRSIEEEEKGNLAQIQTTQMLVVMLQLYIMF
jgi:hypothetical protein